MKENANKIVIALAVLLALVMLAFVIGSGSCGGGGGGGAPAPTSAGASNSSSSNGGSSSASGTGSADVVTIDELEAALATDTAPVGDNARNASTSAGVVSVVDVYKDLESRGFKGIEITANFDLSGAHIDPGVLDAGSADKYPQYSARYVSDTGMVWVVYVTDGVVTASPIGSDEGAMTKEIIVSETDSIVQYNSAKNEFSDFPSDRYSSIAGLKVSRVDKSALDSYNFDMLARM